jgi:hypothetical protein
MTRSRQNNLESLNEGFEKSDEYTNHEETGTQKETHQTD